MVPDTDQELQPGAKHFVVVVPGYMGSQLVDTSSGDTVWLDIPAMIKNPLSIPKSIDQMLERMVYPNPNIQPGGILNQVLFVPPWAKQEHYGRLLEKLAVWGYQIDPKDPAPESLAAYTFAYDWRQDNRLSARQLGQAVETWRDRHNGARAILIGHSNGGIVSRWYIQKEGGKDHVQRLFLMGSPWDGSPKSIKVMLSGLEVLGLRRLNLFNLGERMKDVVRSFPSFYQLIPHTNSFLNNQFNQALDLFGDPSWLDTPQQQAYLADALQFNRDLGLDLDVDTLCFFGRSKETVSSGVVTLSDSGKWGKMQWISTSSGDGTVTEMSAVHPKAHARLPFAVSHGDIYVDDAVLEFLQWELLGKDRGQVRALLTTDAYSVLFEPDRDVYSPGEEIFAYAHLTSLDGDAPVQEADVKARMVFHEPLPGDDTPAGVPEPAEVRLKASMEVPGRYEARFPAPAMEGYYHLEGRVRIVGELPVVLSELVLVEAPPELQL